MKLKNLTDLFLGVVISSLGISFVINANLGSFPITSCNIFLSELLHISYGTASMLIELLMFCICMKFKTKISLGMLVNCFICGYIIDAFNLFIPTMTYPPFQILMLIAGVIIMSVGSFFNIRAALGNSNSNELQTIIQRLTGKSVMFARNTIELVAFLIGLFGSGCGIATPILAILYGVIMNYTFKLLHFDPTTITQSNLSDCFKHNQQKIKELIIE